MSDSPHRADLLLAHACNAGDKQAWERLYRQYREKLYRHALAITNEEGSARELADSVFADLIGDRLKAYSGSGPLEAWLRAVMARTHIDNLRRSRRTISFDAAQAAGHQFEAPAPPAQSDTTPAARAIDRALTALPAEDRFLLAAYYVDERTLAQIGALLGIHESTVSRRIHRITTQLRKAATRGLSKQQKQELSRIDVRDLEVNVRRHLAAKP